jgi:hypothetical protein
VNRLIKLANKAAKLKNDLDIISVTVNSLEISIHLTDYVFDKYKAIYGWETKIKRYDGVRYDLEEFIIINGVRVFALRETMKEEAV